MLTPMQIQNHEFKKGFRGYNEEDVQDFMKQIADDYQILFRDNREMKETIEQLRKQVDECKQRENTAINTLMVAQETAESVREVARKEAAVIVKDAEQQRRNMIAETERQIREGQEKYEAIRSQLAVFRARMESILNAQQELLGEINLPQSRAAFAMDEVVTEPVEEIVEEVVCETEVAETIETPVEETAEESISETEEA